MKTPREVLLNRHQAIKPKLNSIRETVLAAACVHPPRPYLALPLRIVIDAWNELILPARRIWAGFAVVWVAIGALNLANSEPTGGTRTATKPVSSGMVMAWQEQQKVMAELTGPNEPVDTRKPKTVDPKPRSDRLTLWRIG
jgi:hypothetical protein